MLRAKLHLTVAAIVHFQQRFLFVEERDKLTGERVLNQPAGHVEEDEDLITAAIRELAEETGLSLTPCSWLGMSQSKATNDHRYVRVNFVFEPQQLPTHYHAQDADILALHWLNRDELVAHSLPLRSKLVIDAIDSYLAGIRLELNLIQGPA